MRLPENYIEAIKQIMRLKIKCIVLFGLGIAVGMVAMMIIFNLC